MDEASRDHSDRRHFLRVVWRWKWLLLAIAIVPSVTAYAVSESLSKSYRTQTTVLFQGKDRTSPLAAKITVASPRELVHLIQTPVVGNLAARDLGQPASDGNALLSSVNASLQPAGRVALVTITASSSDPQRAAQIAQAFARVVSARPTATNPRPTVVVSPAEPPLAAYSPRPRRNAALGLALGLVLAAATAALLARVDRKLREAADLERMSGAPLLGVIPRVASSDAASQAPVREAFRALGARLISFNADRKLDSVLVTSPAPGDGKTTVAVNVARALAQDGRDVVLVDVDRRGEVAARTGVHCSVGLDAVLLGHHAIEDALVDVPDVTGPLGGGLRVVTAVSSPHGPSDLSVVLGSARTPPILAQLAGSAGIVVIDAPSPLAVSDAIPLLGEVSGVVLVARIGHTTRDAIEELCELISQAHGSLLGTVATDEEAAGPFAYEDAREGEDARSETEPERALGLAAER